MCCKNNESIISDNVQAILDKYKGNSAALITCLQDIQSELTYIPEDLMPAISNALHVPESDIYSIITFYTQFNLKPQAKYKIEICMGTACYILGADDLLNHLKTKLNISMGEMTEDKKFEIAQSRCFGCCNMAPVININGKIYGKVTVEQLDKLINECN